MANRTLRFDDFDVDLRAGELLKHGHKVKLQEKPFQILEILLEQPGEMVSREEVTKRLWPDDTFVDFERGLNTAIGKLRTALGDSAEKPRYIETVARRGYRFIGVVDGVEHLAHSEGRRWNPVLTTAVLLCATAAIVIGLNVGGLRDRLAGQAPSEQIRSIAVLPLQNTSGNPEDEYFADGMTDLLIADLAKISSLKVISRTSAMRYKSSNKALPEIARELGVDAIVQGSALRVGDRVRITAQLIDASTEQHLWTENYERDLRDVLLLQSDVAHTIANEIRVNLTPQDETRLARAAPIDPEASQAYLKALFYFNAAIHERNVEQRVQSHQKSFDYFQRAIAKAPAFAPAYAGLAFSYHWLGVWGFPEYYPKAKATAAEALRIDDTVAEAHYSLAFTIHQLDWNWLDAETHYQRAIELNPSSGDVYHGYSLYLSAAGRHGEAIAMGRRAEELDPLVLPLKANLVLIYIMAREYEHAIAQMQQVLELNPAGPHNHSLLGRAYVFSGQHDKGIGQFRNALEISNSPPYVAQMAWGLAMTGRRAEAEALLPALIERPPQREMGGGASSMAQIYAALGDADRAFDWLDKALEQREILVTLSRVDPSFDSLRADPRFRDLLRRINYPE